MPVALAFFVRLESTNLGRITTMGLAERRIQNDFKDGKLSELVSELHEVVGSKVKVNVDFETIGEPDLSMADSYADAMESIYFRPTIDALKVICVDDFGKKAAQDTLKEIRFKDSKKISNPKDGLTMDEGVLTFDYQMYMGIDASYEKDRTDAISKFLSDNL